MSVGKSSAFEISGRRLGKCLFVFLGLLFIFVGNSFASSVVKCSLLEEVAISQRWHSSADYLRLVGMTGHRASRGSADRSGSKSDALLK